MSEIDTLRKEMNEQMTALRGEVKEVTKVLLELVRLDGVIKNQDTLINRVGSEVDDHEKRIRAMEVKNSVNTTKISNTERIAWLVVTTAFSLAVFLIKG